jgi:hypothetical protein
MAVVTFGCSSVLSLHARMAHQRLSMDHGGCGRLCGAWDVRRGSAGTHAQLRTGQTKDLQRDPGTVTPQAP